MIQRAERLPPAVPHDVLRGCNDVGCDCRIGSQTG
jgi:hypothetical protein